MEYRNWEAEQAAEWVEVVKRNGHSQQAGQTSALSQPVRLSGANTIPISGDHRRSSSSNVYGNNDRQSVFSHIQFKSKVNLHNSPSDRAKSKVFIPSVSNFCPTSILGPIPEKHLTHQNYKA